jgi:hypothetical protein
MLGFKARTLTFPNGRIAMRGCNVRIHYILVCNRQSAIVESSRIRSSGAESVLKQLKTNWFRLYAGELKLLVGLGGKYP